MKHFKNIFYQKNVDLRTSWYINTAATRGAGGASMFPLFPHIQVKFYFQTFKKKIEGLGILLVFYYRVGQEYWYIVRRCQSKNLILRYA